MNYSHMANIAQPTSVYFALYPEDARPMILPFFRLELAELYEMQRDAFWTPNDIDTTEDATHYTQKLNDGERRFVKYILAFFARGDGVVNDLIAARLTSEVPFLESAFFYRSQASMEDVHAQVYAKLLLDIVADPDERRGVLEDILWRPTVQAMLKYMEASADPTILLPEFLLRMVFIEGVFFQGCFCVIYWLQSRGLMPGLGQSNQQISRDEGLHTRKHAATYRLLLPVWRVKRSQVEQIARTVCELACDFLADGLHVDQPNMNQGLLRSYVEQTIDERLALVGEDPLYGTKHTFSFMTTLSLPKKTSFFERRVTDYRKADSASSHSMLELCDDY